MEKLASSKEFGKIIVKNYDYRPTMYEELEDFIPIFGGIARIRRKHYFKGRGERTYLYVNGSLKACGKYTRINRPRQCFDFQMSMLDAISHALENITRSEYEEIRGDLIKMREYLKD